MNRQAGGSATRPQAANLRHYVLERALVPAPDFVMGRRLQFDYFSSVPIFHECQRCTACCRWPGQVRLTDAEITRIAEFLGEGEHEFIQQFTRLNQDRQRLVLEEKSNGECVFLNGNDCAVQPVKPRQCRDFPNLWNFPGFEKTCHAIPRLVSEAEFRRRVAKATGRSEHEIAIGP